MGMVELYCVVYFLRLHPQRYPVICLVSVKSQ